MHSSLSDPAHLDLQEFKITINPFRPCHDLNSWEDRDQEINIFLFTPKILMFECKWQPGCGRASQVSGESSPIRRQFQIVPPGGGEVRDSPRVGGEALMATSRIYCHATLSYRTGPFPHKNTTEIKTWVLDYLRHVYVLSFHFIESILCSLKMQLLKSKQI